MIIFPEYARLNTAGYTLTPFIVDNQFHIGPYPASLKEVGEFCGLDDEELTMLALTYGILQNPA